MPSSVTANRIVLQLCTVHLQVPQKKSQKVRYLATGVTHKNDPISSYCCLYYQSLTRSLSRAGIHWNKKIPKICLTSQIDTQLGSTSTPWEVWANPRGLLARTTIDTLRLWVYKYEDTKIVLHIKYNTHLLSTCLDVPCPWLHYRKREFMCLP